MHYFILLPLLATAGLCMPQEQKYTDRFDNINVDEIIANRRLLVPYVRCVLEQGKCTPEGKELKVHVTDAMQTACKKCTDKQKDGARKVVNHIRANELEYWEQLQTKYDPTGEFKPIYEAFLAGEEPKVKDTESVGDNKTNTGEEKIANVEEKKGDLVEEKKTDLVEAKKVGVITNTKVVEEKTNLEEGTVGGLEEGAAGGLEEGAVGSLEEGPIGGIVEEKVVGLGEEKIGGIGEERKSADLVDARSKSETVEFKKTETVDKKSEEGFGGEGRFI